MNAITRMAILIAVAGSLGGCQALNLPSLVFKSKPRTEATAWVPTKDTDYAASLTEGRAALSAGNLSEAAALFRIAQGSEATYAEATNGIAVAYAKLGRADIAERYFRMAMEAQPDDPKFAGNLLRLQQNVLARNQRELEARIAAANKQLRAVADQRASLLAAAAGNAQHATLTQTSRGMVSITTPSELAAAPEITVASRTKKIAAKAPAEVETETLQENSVIAIAGETGRAIYPVRFKLGR